MAVAVVTTKVVHSFLVLITGLEGRDISVVLCLYYENVALHLTHSVSFKASTVSEFREI